MVPKFNVAAIKLEVVLTEWLCVVFDGFSDCYASLSRYIDYYVADLAEQQTKNNTALKPELVLSPLLEWIIRLSTA